MGMECKTPPKGNNPCDMNFEFYRGITYEGSDKPSNLNSNSNLSLVIWD